MRARMARASEDGAAVAGRAEANGVAVAFTPGGGDGAPAVARHRSRLRQAATCLARVQWRRWQELQSLVRDLTRPRVNWTPRETGRCALQVQRSAAWGFRAPGLSWIRVGSAPLPCKPPSVLAFRSAWGANLMAY